MVLEEEMATHSSSLAWRIHEQRSLVGYSPWRQSWTRLSVSTRVTEPEQDSTALVFSSTYRPLLFHLLSILLPLCFKV